MRRQVIFTLTGDGLFMNCLCSHWDTAPCQQQALPDSSLCKVCDRGYCCLMTITSPGALVACTHADSPNLRFTTTTQSGSWRFLMGGPVLNIPGNIVITGGFPG